MEITELKTQIKSGTFDKMYVFCGEEHTVMKIYLKMMAEKGKYQLTYVDSLMDILTGVRTKSLVSVHHLYVIMDDKEYLTNEKLQARFTGLKDDIVVMYYTTTDKRLKFWKNNKDRAVEFAKLDTRVLTKYIQKEIPFSTTSCELLADVCEHDYGRILLEIDKIKDYIQGAKNEYGEFSNINIDETLEYLLSQGVIYRNPKDAIFDFVAAFLERKPATAYSLLQDCKAVGESNLNILANLYNSIKTLLQVQSAKDYKALGLNGWQLKNVLPYRNNYSNGELVKAMKLIRECEKGIKIGSIPEDLAVEYLMVQVM